MPTDLANLKAARTSLITNLATVAAAGPKVTYSVDGQSVDWNAYRSSMLKDLAALEEQISAEEPAYVISSVIV